MVGVHGWDAITDVKAIENSPPPAPASACATLSLCWAAALEEDVDWADSKILFGVFVEAIVMGGVLLG